MHALVFLILAAPKPFTCTIDGAETKVVADAAQVSTDALKRRRLGFSLAGDANSYPRIDVSAAWESLEGKPAVTLSVSKPTLGSELQAFFLAAVSGQRASAEKATAAFKLEEKSVSIELDVTFREGKKRDGAAHTVKCSLAGLPLVVGP